MNKLALFDIDNTLIRSSKVHRLSFSEGFRKVYGVDTSIDIINHHGMTDQLIIIEVLKKNGLKEKEIKSKLKKCTEVMIDYFNKNIDGEEIMVLDGVRKLLEELNKHKVLIGVVTGNLEPIARGKLKKAGIDHYFKVGGFGSDDAKRSNLVRIAIKRAEENFDFRFSRNNVFLFGDAPQDIKAGKEVGVKTIGVTTGIYSKEELEKAGADFILESLKDTDKILKIIFPNSNIE
jgi:phosphoglycolate phosphatase-like HAD superfamily hydrolase